MIIRRAEQEDLARLVEIEGLCFPEETAFPAAMFAYLIRYSEALVACEPGGEVAGFIIGYASGSGGSIYTLDVHPRYRRKGIASRLIRALEKDLRSLGAKSIRLEAAIEDEGARELYRKAGYRERWLARNYYGRGKHAVRMSREL